ncbi:hypothetical protein [Halobacillus salinus]|uniref:Uncharacterized protein n=1 Tax=Halobacillus salinus TaxID=192814 RepID=A0A4Z0GU40_9BACI|nr:hypothetical protein [Halobacillus salinus]TGB01196.1 hypothetical protein E4663_17105 [Halobacillus salinus]
MQRFLIWIGCALLLAGCTSGEEEQKQTTMEEAFYESYTDGEELFYTAETAEGIGIAFFEIEKGYGLANLEKRESGWFSTGAATYEMEEPVPEKEVSTRTSVSTNGNLEAFAEPAYQTVIWGEVYGDEITSLHIKGESYEEEAEIIENGDKRFYYFVPEGSTLEVDMDSIQGFDTDGELVYEESL